MCDIGAMQVADGRFYEKGKLGGSAGGSAGGFASDSKDKENWVVAQKCAEPGTQRRSRCGRRDRSCRCGRCGRRKSPREGKLGGSAGDSKDKENCGVAQKCAEPGTQRRNRCGGCGGCSGSPAVTFSVHLFSSARREEQFTSHGGKNSSHHSVGRTVHLAGHASAPLRYTVIVRMDAGYASREHNTYPPIKSPM